MLPALMISLGTNRVKEMKRCVEGLEGWVEMLREADEDITDDV
jgi:hypothetical protein